MFKRMEEKPADGSQMHRNHVQVKEDPMPKAAEFGRVLGQNLLILPEEHV